jgi:hypothetical protein
MLTSLPAIVGRRPLGGQPTGRKRFVMLNRLLDLVLSWLH